MQNETLIISSEREIYITYDSIDDNYYVMIDNGRFLSSSVHYTPTCANFEFENNRIMIFNTNDGVIAEITYNNITEQIVLPIIERQFECDVFYEIWIFQNPIIEYDNDEQKRKRKRMEIDT